MPLKPPESYELDRPETSPFLGRHSISSDASDRELEKLDPLVEESRTPAWLSGKRQPTWQNWLVPSRFCCMLVALFFATLILLLAAGGLWLSKVGGVPEDGQSEPWYPSPSGGTLESWKESYAKAAHLVKQMTLVEKVNITTGTGWSMGPCVGNTGPVDRLGFPSLCLQDGPLGLRFVDNASSFPAGITVGATWNKDLMYERGKAHGLEARLKGINVILGPSMGPLGRLPAGGRNWEGFGSDPVLQGIAAAQTIRGIQESGVIATAKHFVGNEQEHYRQSWEWGTPNAISSNIDDRSLHELYAWPFADSIRAGVASLMCSYNQVNNSYACQNSKLMNGIIKDEMGFQGFIQSDWLAQRSGVASALAGLDMSMPGDGLRWQDGETLWGGKLTHAILNGSVPMDRLNDMALRVVAAWYQLGQDDKNKWGNNTLSSPATFSSWSDKETDLLHPGSPGSTEKGVVNKFVPVRHTTEGGDHDKLARKIAAEGIVLVKNENAILPIKKDGTDIPRTTTSVTRSSKKVRVGIFGEDAFANPKGPNACVDRGCNEYTLATGWGSGASDFPHLVPPFDALNATFDHDAVAITAHREQAAKSAGIIAEDQDLCIVFATSDAGEGFLSWSNVKGDRPALEVQKGGDALIVEVAEKCGKSSGSLANTVVVLHAVGPTILEEWIDLPGVKAVLLAHLPGEESGNALVDVLFGDENPSGRLPYTIAKTEGDYGPSSKILTVPNHIVPQQNFSEGLYIDYRYFDKHDIEPRYEFGYGLSYTQFHLSSVLVNPITARGNQPAKRPDGLQPPQLNTTIPDSKTAIFPSGFRKLKKYIYPYIDKATWIQPQPIPDYPPTFDPTKPHPLSPAGGGPGGNPDLFTKVATVQASLTNTGSVSGSAVVQLYISFPSEVRDMDGELVDMPVKVLRAFEKIHVETDKREEVKLELTRRDLSFWDVKAQNWVMPKGDFTMHLGWSSRDLPETVTFNPFGLSL